MMREIRIMRTSAWGGEEGMLASKKGFFAAAQASRSFFCSYIFL